MAAGRPALARALLQQCLSARLQVKPPDRGSEAQWVEVQRGLVIYICFFKGADEDLIPKIEYRNKEQRPREDTSCSVEAMDKKRWGTGQH